MIKAQKKQGKAFPLKSMQKLRANMVYQGDPLFFSLSGTDLFSGKTESLNDYLVLNKFNVIYEEVTT